MTAPIERVITSGTFSLDGGTWDVDNNVWLVGDADGLVVIDPAHDAEAILAAIGGRPVSAIVATHGHDDHISAVRVVADEPYVVRDVEVLAVQAEDPTDDGLLDACAHCSTPDSFRSSVAVPRKREVPPAGCDARSPVVLASLISRHPRTTRPARW